ncbi:Hxt1p [Saccharomyces cerevisiae x Saccharomyces kudriavzevii VIN7]|nr:Hxt1p [Saccharomyces cerevisiae x Saccharomyces kudriavzevii VIN7]
MVVFASVGVTRLYPNGSDAPSSKGAGNCMIVFTMFYIFFFATTWAPVAYIVVAESFPQKVKTKAMAISTAFNWFWQFLIGFFTPFHYRRNQLLLWLRVCRVFSGNVPVCFLLFA